ncbi:adenomatous polyposis coli protein-like [Coccinella septempunctata]|uniref:adenomatous polyposis coli protein-like n=1 Tax=Coccinella septempunctata TaxID=41139 RepID=UPI001D09053B|nr:adenomatous polyposis coli protein-like [Coccinella septempunctata]
MEDYSEPLDLSLPSVKMKNNHSNTDLPLDLSKKRIDNPQIVHSGPFSNSIIKNIPNFSCDKRSRMHQACGPSSLPYMNSTKPRNAHSCIPVRNNYADNYEDELETSETPFDFSCRYAETKTCNNGQKNEHSNSNYKGKKSKNNNGNFSIYAETDLDQPTDYSLRYAENNPESDVEVCDNEEKTATTEFVGDSVKTYCTEGTPYETPFNFSTSTSMSDLRIGDKNLADGIDMREKKMKMEKSTPENEISDKISEEEIIVTDDQPQTPKMKSEFNSGLTSPEKPMNYCEEGTPGYFSRVSSFGSLNSAAAGSGEEKSSEDKDKCEDRLNTPKSDKMHQKLPGSEVKVVKFENIVNYCEETPLMFSRSSSLGSLDSIEQSMHDDRSSVISDFSRLTSGIISPSEIPDSPTQTVPPSPKQRKSSDLGGMRRQSSARRSLPIKWSIFEDDVTKFKEENTPAQFSVATSLSSLTIDDHDEPQMQNKSEQNCANGNRRDEQDENITMAKDSLHEETDRVSFHNTRENMQNRCFPLSGSGQFQSNFQDSPSLAYNDVSSKLPSRVLPPPLSAENNTRTYNTEDTPAVLSRNGSVSELSLSTLSILDEEPAPNRVYLSENSSQSSGERRNNLEKEKWSETSGNRIEVENVWVRRQSTKSSSPYRNVDNLPPFVASKDECCRFAVEDSPAQFSLRSSLSHLTIESEMASGILDFSLPKEASESPLRDNQENTVNTAEHDLEHPVDVVDSKEESSASSKDQEDEVVTENTSTDLCSHEEENINPSNENTQSFELKSDDSRYNSMKKRKWKWKWQFGSEDGQHSESGDSTQTDRLSSINNEEFDNGRRGRSEKNNGGSLDASFKKKKWWKWKFISKEKDQAGGAANVQETAHDSAVDDAQSQIANSSEDRESYSKEAGTLETRNKSKRWKWKWKLNFKDDENSKSEKSSLGLSKLKHHVSPEIAKEPLCVNDVFQSTDGPNEKKLVVKFLPENRNGAVSEVDGKSIEMAKPDDQSPKNTIRDEVRPAPVREKLDTPEPSDSEDSVIIEEINELSLSDVYQKSNKRIVLDHASKSEEVGGSENGTRKIMCDDQSDYAVLVEECIQLGMPKKKALAKNVPLNHSPALSFSPQRINGLDKSEPNKENCDIFTYNRASDYEINDEYIELARKNNGGDVDSNKYIETNSVHSNPSYPAVRNANRITNFDSSSLNRFSLGKASRNVFNSNDNILGDIPNRTSEKVNNPNVKRPSYGGFDGEGKTPVVTKTECSNKPKVSGEIKEFVNGRITKQEMINSQSKRTVPKMSESPYNTGRSNLSSSDKIIPKNTAQASSRSEISVKSGCSTTSGKSPDFAALIEECIQLGMPKRRESSEETLSPTLSPSLMHQKQNYAKRWPEYLSRISNGK